MPPTRPSGTPQDLVAGLLFTVVGSAFALGAQQYALGSSVQPGPGYFPTGLGVLLVLCGVGLILRAARAGRQATVSSSSRWVDWGQRLRPLGAVLGALASFAWALPHVGLLLAVVLMVHLALLAVPGFEWWFALRLSVALALGAGLIFAAGLGLPLPLWPAGGGALAP